MLTTSVIHVAILVYFSVSSGHGLNIDLHAAQKAVVKAEEKVVLLGQPFCEKCVVRSEVRSPLPAKVVSFHWDIEKLTFSHMFPMTGRRPAPYGYMTEEFDKRVSDI